MYFLADLALFGLQKADLEKEASPQLVQVNLKKPLIISVYVLRLTGAFIVVEDIKGNFLNLSRNVYF